MGVIIALLVALALFVGVQVYALPGVYRRRSISIRFGGERDGSSREEEFC